MVSRIDSRIKKALITGGYSGLGREFALMLKSHGVEVWCTTRDAKSVEAIEGIHCVELDLTDKQSVQSCIEAVIQLHEFDLFINNAGFGVWGEFRDFTAIDIEGQLEVMLHQPILLSQAFLSLKPLGSFSVLVNVSSLASQLPIPYFSIYNSSKAALSSFSQSLMLEYEGSSSFIIDFQLGDFNTGFNQATRRYINTGISNSWLKLEKHLQEGPDPRVAAESLEKALIIPKNRLLCAGGFFQRVLAPFARRLLSLKILLKFIRNYYS